MSVEVKISIKDKEKGSKTSVQVSGIVTRDGASDLMDDALEQFDRLREGTTTLDGTDWSSKGRKRKPSSGD